MKIPILFDNIAFAIQQGGGISVVFYELFKRLLHDSEFDIDFYEHSEGANNFYRKQLNLDNDRIKEIRLPLLLGRYLNPKMGIKNPYVFHSTYYRTSSDKAALNVTTVHDFTYELYREGLPTVVHHWQKGNAVRRSDAVICISENTKNDLLRYYPEIDEQKVRVIYNGVSEEYKIERETPIDLPFNSGSFLLFVGARYDYKNFRLAVESAAKSGMNLLVIGKQFTDEEKLFISSHMADDKCKVFSNVANEKLNLLYNHAYCLLYPSSYEGFGIPVLEAQRAGCPVIAMNKSSIPEVIGDTPLLIQHEDVDEVVSKISLLNDKELRQTVIEEGLKNSLRFSWDKMYEEYKEVYKGLIENV